MSSKAKFTTNWKNMLPYWSRLKSIFIDDLDKIKQLDTWMKEIEGWAEARKQAYQQTKVNRTPAPNTLVPQAAPISQAQVKLQAKQKRSPTFIPVPQEEVEDEDARQALENEAWEELVEETLKNKGIT